MLLNKSIIFVGGLVIGAAGGVLTTMTYFKNKYSKIADQQISEMSEYYQYRDTYARPNADDLVEDEAEVNPVNNNEDRSQGVLSAEAREEIKQKLIRNHEVTTNYAKIYEEQHPDLFKQAAMMTDEEIEANEEPDILEQVNREHQLHKDDPPKIISVDEFDNLPPHIDRETLFFYNLDETLVDDEDDVIDDPAVLVGNALNNSDWIDSGEDMLFVYNPHIDTAYEIQRVDEAWYGGGR